jgi:hypothetical protein
VGGAGRALRRVIAMMTSSPTTSQEHTLNAESVGSRLGSQGNWLFGIVHFTEEEN